jgi:transposase
MRRLASDRPSGTPANHMTNKGPNTSEVRAEQVTNQPYEQIYLGLDLHKPSIRLTRIIDGATPEAARRLSWDQLWDFVQKQRALAKKVYVVYEAGAFGFWPCRKLQQMGVDCWVIHPEKLDPRQRRVQTDRLDALQLALKLQRYVVGNKKAMTVVYVPTEAEEQQRLTARHRDHLSQQIQRLRARGRGLLLSQGIFQTSSWYRNSQWEQLKVKVTPALRKVLEDLRHSLEGLGQQLAEVERDLEATAPKQLPKGFGKLSFVLLARLLCNYQRFKSRRHIAGFTGLCGGVSASGPYHLDLSINKAGSPRIRALLIELAWRMIYWQPNYTGLKTWKRLGGARAAKRRRKVALVAVGRQLVVDVWRWQTGLVTAEQLGWQMSSSS